MSADNNKALVRRYHDAFSASDLDAMIAAFETEAIIHTSSSAAPLSVEDFKQLGGVFLSAFPDGTVTVDDLLEDADKVVSRITFRGTHTGELMGIAPTGKTVSVSEIIIDRFTDGRIVESWRLFDRMGMMEQLGLVP